MGIALEPDYEGIVNEYGSVVNNDRSIVCDLAVSRV
jgi:hypothetical protein